MKMPDVGEEVDFTQLIGREVIYQSTEGPKIAVLNIFSADSDVVTIELEENEVKEVNIGDIESDMDLIAQLKYKDSIEDKFTVIRNLTTEQIKEKLSNFGHKNEILNFDDPELITINDFNNISQLISSEPNHNVIKALKVRDLWDNDDHYDADEENHILHVNIIASIAFPEAFFDFGLNISSTAITKAAVDELYTYDVAVEKNDGDVTLTSISVPGWLTLNPGTHVLSGTPTNTDVGNHEVVITAKDSDRLAIQQFTINVSESYENKSTKSEARYAKLEMGG
jgi:hypothetical protein